MLVITAWARRRTRQAPCLANSHKQIKKVYSMKSFRTSRGDEPLVPAQLVNGGALAHGPVETINCVMILQDQFYQPCFWTLLSSHVMPLHHAIIQNPLQTRLAHVFSVKSNHFSRTTPVSFSKNHRRKKKSQINTRQSSHD